MICRLKGHCIIISFVLMKENDAKGGKLGWIMVLWEEIVVYDSISNVRKGAGMKKILVMGGISGVRSTAI